MDPRRALSFGPMATAYERGRPTYPVEAVRWTLPAEPRRVLDLAAGTGKLSAVLLELGLDAVAVEPDDEMRALVPVEALAGTAEQIPLPDASVDAVVVGQAFHWFDPARAVPEMARVLRPGGTAGLFWNLFDDRVPWVAELCDLWNPEDRWSVLADLPSPISDDAFEAGEKRQVEHVHEVDVELLLDNLRSRSPVILMDPGEREELLARVRQVVPGDSFALPYVCTAWRIARR